MSSASALSTVLERAHAATEVMRHSFPADRAGWLEAAAEALDASADKLVGVAIRETHLTGPRLSGELRRTTFQLRLFAEAIRGGAFLDARIDRADDAWPMGPRPDIRRVKVAVGAVLVYAASNFPFAFSVAGGDSASALAAGCPVIVKAHEAHPRLSADTLRVVSEAMSNAGAPPGAFQGITDREDGIAALQDPRVAAAGFTGSIAAGRALYDIACRRDVPIPFYGEMGSVNPTVITTAAVRDRLAAIVDGFIASVTNGVGQFCTKPGVVFVPAGSAFEEAIRHVGLPEIGPMLTDRIARSFRDSVAALSERVGVEVIAGGRGPIDPIIFGTTLDRLSADRKALTTECFGPSSLLVRYDALGSVTAELARMEGQLTGSVFGSETEDLAALIDALSQRTGRVLWNSWPTGVSVTHAQQHGGPFPATTIDNSTSVGTAAMERWLRPVAYQSMPQHLLPPPLRDDNPWGVPQTRH